MAGLILCGIHPAEAQQTVGLFLNEDGAFEGYSLFTPISSQTTYLIDNEGRLINSWVASARPAMSVYLLESGNLLRTAKYAPGPTRFDSAGGAGGRAEEYTWDGTLVWGHDYTGDVQRQHHDIEMLPNGNLLMIAWEYKTEAEAIAAGRDPALITQGELWPDHVIEVQPSGHASGTIVWEWHVWDHLIQDFEPTKPDFGVVGDHPELIDLNYDADTGSTQGRADWTHINSIDYNETFDQIILSVHGLSEVWIIDHSTSTTEAAGHTGGNSGKGGDLLYRWGNPEAYGRGVSTDRWLYSQHDARWIESGLPGAGNIMIFNNGTRRPGADFTSVDEIVPPVDESGNYSMETGSAFGPPEVLWSYTASLPTEFFAWNVSGAHRLPNGNTLICDGPLGTFFEVTEAKATVWRYVNPISADLPITQGDPAASNLVFRVHRYPPDYLGLIGKDLTPGDPLEEYVRPIPVPDGGAATSPMASSRITTAGDWIQVDWDAASCPAQDYNLLYGNLADLSAYALQGSVCALGISGSYDWSAVPAGDLYYLVVGTDGTGVYESSWGVDGAGAERNGTSPSVMCGVTTKDIVEECP